MSEKQIDLDAMRALADHPDDDNCVICARRNEILRTGAAEIEQSRKERDALLAFIQGETDACTNSHLGGPCGQCAARRAALAAQGAKPRD